MKINCKVWPNSPGEISAFVDLYMAAVQECHNVCLHVRTQMNKFEGQDI